MASISAAAGILIASLFTLNTPLLAEKKVAPPPQTWPTSRTLSAPCESVWTVAVQSTVADGWSVKNSDRAGGILTLESTRGEQVGGYRAINPLVGRYTTAKSTGFWTQYTGFRMAGATVILAPAATGCSATVSVTYHGREIRAGSGQQWWVLQSNGYLEDQLLSKIAEKAH